MIFTTRKLHDNEHPPRVEAVTYVSEELGAALEHGYRGGDGATIQDWADAHSREFFRRLFIEPHEESCGEGFAGRVDGEDVIHSDDHGPEMAELLAGHPATDQDAMRIDYELRVLEPGFSPDAVTAETDPNAMMTALQKASHAIVTLSLEP